MGENKHVKELDAFAKKYIKDIEPEKPSVDFSSIVMQKINTDAKSSVYHTKALISKKVWFVLGALFVALFFIPFQESSFINLSDFSLFDEIQIPNILENLSVSSITFYAILFFGLMLFTQIFYLKRHFENRINK